MQVELHILFSPFLADEADHLVIVRGDAVVPVPLVVTGPALLADTTPPRQTTTNARGVAPPPIITPNTARLVANLTARKKVARKKVARKRKKRKKRRKKRKVVEVRSWLKRIGRLKRPMN